MIGVAMSLSCMYLHRNSFLEPFFFSRFQPSAQHILFTWVSQRAGRSDSDWSISPPPPPLMAIKGAAFSTPVGYTIIHNLRKLDFIMCMQVMMKGGGEMIRVFKHYLYGVVSGKFLYRP